MNMQRKTITIDTADLGDRTIRFCISNEVEDREGDILVASGCDFSNFAKNPQFLGFHNYWDYPLGVPKKWWIDQRQRKVYADVYFPTVDELATDPQYASEKAKLVDTTYNMYKIGMLNAVSVGFCIKESSSNSESKTGYGKIISKWELLEFSAVPIPCNQNALAEARKSFDPGAVKMIEEAQMKMQAKGALPFKKYPLADEDTSWDGPNVIAESDVSDLKIICAWVSSEKDNSELVKSDFKLPHHMGKEDGYKTVWKGVASAMAALLGSRGGVNIPESDRDAVYAHLKKHYEEFDKEIPEKSAIKTGARLSTATLDMISEIGKCHGKIKKATEDMLVHHKELSDLMEKLINGDVIPSEPDEDDLFLDVNE